MTSGVFSIHFFHSLAPADSTSKWQPEFKKWCCFWNLIRMRKICRFCLHFFYRGKRSVALKKQHFSVSNQSSLCKYFWITPDIWSCDSMYTWDLKKFFQWSRLKHHTDIAFWSSVTNLFNLACPGITPQNIWFWVDPFIFSFLNKLKEKAEKQLLISKLY